VTRGIRPERYRHGTPIEEAPPWALAILVALLWLVTFPALAGLLAGLGAWHGQTVVVALAALGVAVLVVVGAATRKPWRRRGPRDLHDERPLLVRFSTWLWAALLFPNFLFGVLVLTREGPPLTYVDALVLGVIVSTVHGVWAGAARLRRRWNERHAGRVEGEARLEEETRSRD
jgi:hypothetical protein